ncbi:LacI family DNA-binding transcriptional regulator [Streptomyces sp. NPDC006529]|uniref:LacI family DNA-binding transcriptional regulator n=1 Tax=Streptomyces sp. NPDC006529 TaxID=3157177 RepID=UPI0033A9265C
MDTGRHTGGSGGTGSGAGAAPTLEDVARAAGVSRATVSRVVNGIRNVDPAIRRAVERAVDATGYVPNRAARSLVTRRAGAVALVVSGAGTDAPDDFAARVFQDPFFGRVVSGVVRALRPRGVHPVLMCAETGADRAQLVAYLAQGGADGALLVSTHPRDPLPGLLAGAGLPAVLFARPEPDVPLPSVDLRHRDGGALAARHLIAGGHRRIAVVSGPSDVPASRERVAGCADALREAGRRSIAVAEADFTVEGGERAMLRLLAEHPDLDAVFAANDLMAQGACLVLREHGRRIPDDVAVVGFDDSSAATACRPRLTTVRQPVEDMAAEMVRLLLDESPAPGGPGGPPGPPGAPGLAVDAAVPVGCAPVLFAPRLVVRDSA